MSVEQLISTIERITAERNALAAELAKAREALMPFSTCWTDEELDGAPDDMVVGNALEEGSQPTVGDLRRARLAAKPEATP